jgi:hypothetical protein
MVLFGDDSTLRLISELLSRSSTAELRPALIPFGHADRFGEPYGAVMPCLEWEL